MKHITTLTIVVRNFCEKGPKADTWLTRVAGIGASLHEEIVPRGEADYSHF